MSVLSRFATSVGLCVGVGVLSASWAWAQPECDPPPLSIPVDSGYNYDVNGAFWLVDQSTTVQTPMDSPSVLRIASKFGTWTYVVGTSPAFSEGNLAVYRTQDFRTFQLHMLAFSPSWQSGSAVYLNNGRIFNRLRNPQLYIDPSLLVPLPAGSGTRSGSDRIGDDDGGWAEPPPIDHDPDGPELPDPPQDEAALGLNPEADAATTAATDPVINLTFSAITSTGAPSTDESLRACFQVRIRQSQFLAWHGSSSSRMYFADPTGQFPWQAWFGYIQNNGAGAYLYDGGFAQRGLIPASGSSALLGPGVGQVFRQDFGGITFGLAHRYAPQRSTWMYDHPFVYLNGSPAPENRVQFFTFVNEPLPGSTQNGFHIAGHPTRSSQFLFDAYFITQFMANNFNTNNRVGSLWNGTVGAGGGQAVIGGMNSAVATGACAFRHGGRHYLLYCRNTEDSPAYQIVYRKTGVNQPVGSLIMPNYYSGESIGEDVVLRASTFDQASGVNYGNPEVFRVHPGGMGPYQEDRGYLILAFRIRIPVTGGFAYRPMFKELTIDPTTGNILQLREGGSDVRADIFRLRVPRCRY